MLFSANDALIGRSLQYYGEYCEDEVRLFRSVVKSGHTVLDIGANIGAHTVSLATTVGRTGRVIAIEPLRSNFHMLCANIVLNALDQVETLRAAVGRNEGVVQVPHVPLSNPGNQGAFSLCDPMDEDAKLEAVTLTTIDALDLPVCHFAKIDVEGMEEDVVRGGVAAIARHQPILYLENNRRDRSSGLIQCLLDIGYRCFWYPVRYFNPENFFGYAENLFQKDIELNMVAVPRVVAHLVTGLQAVDGPEDWPLQQ